MHGVILNTKFTGGSDKPCIGDSVSFICSAANPSTAILSLSSGDFGGVTVYFFLNDSHPVRTPGHYYTVTLVSSYPFFTVVAEVTATLALNGSKVTCEESENGVTFTLIGSGYLDVQGQLLLALT